MNSFIFKKKSGFSLIELMIATAIFTLVMVVAIGAFMSSSNSSNKTKALRIAMDNINFAMDYITRELRVGYAYDYTTSGSDINYMPYDLSKPAQYFHLMGQSIERCDFGTTSCSLLTAPEVKITKLYFKIYDDVSVNVIGTQPSVYIEIEGEVNINGVVEEFDLHTLASQRNAI